MRHIAGHDALGIHADAGEQHEHLFGGGVLRFIENNERIVKSTTTHVSEGRYFDDFAGKSTLQFLRFHHIVQGVVERSQIGRDFFLQIAREKSKRLACLDCRPRQNDSRDLFFL